MNLPDRNRIQKIVRDSLADILMIPPHKIQLTNSLGRDLKLNGDDFSFLFVPEIEKTLRVKTTPEDWKNVYTVQDAIDVFTRAVVSRRQSR